MISFTEQELRRFAPPPKSASKLEVYERCIAAICSDEGRVTMQQYGIETALDFCHFMANIAHECGAFTITFESGYYSASRIQQIFGKGRHSASISASEARYIASLPVTPLGDGKRAEVLFDRVYGIGNNRKAREFGHTKPLDGYRYRGQGLIQTTGKSAYVALAQHLGVDLVERPELLQDPVNGLKAACWEWKDSNCSRWARQDNARMVRRTINGGYNGMDEVEAYLRKAKALWGKRTPETVTVAVPETSTRQAPGHPRLRPGDEGDAVAELQTMLQQLRYHLGRVDKDFGPRTAEALLGFKQQHGLPLNDEVGTEVWAALESAIGEGKTRDMGARAEITAADLPDSTTIKRFSLLGRIAKWTWRTFFGGVTLETLGVDVLDRSTDMALRIIGIFGKFTSAGAGSVKFWLLVAMAAISIIAFLIARWAQDGVDNRVAEAATGKNLSK